MDRRQRKTREAIFRGFTELLATKDFNQITVGQIIAAADVGRATFYAHFETKDLLLKEFCEELFCHIFDAEMGDGRGHRHIFACDGAEPVFLHLFQHLRKNDHQILVLLTSRNNELFSAYFRRSLEALVESHLDLFRSEKSEGLPASFWKNHIASTFVETTRWWADNGMRESPEVIHQYFLQALK
jgi:AcrR family transcriptional regulator